MSFTRLFVHFNDCRDSSRVEILEDETVVSHITPFVYNDKSDTVEKVVQYLESWKEFLNLDESERKAIKQELRASDQPQTVQVGTIRDIYRRVIAAQLKGFERVGCENIDDPKQRIVGSWKGKKVEVLGYARRRPTQEEVQQDVDTIGKYQRKLIRRFGEKRVDRVMRAHQKDFSKMPSLTVEDVHQLTTGLVDINSEDVQDCYEQIKALLKENDPYKKMRMIEKMPKKIKKAILGQDKLDKSLETQATQICEKLRERFSVTNPMPDRYTDLPREQVKYLIDLVAVPLKDLEKSLLGKRMEGVVEGHFPFSSKYCYIYSKLAEDIGRIQAIQEVMEHQGNDETFFLEMWTKLFIKKEVSKAVDLLSGMIVPGLNGEWYRIENQESSKGKFVFCLEPLTNPDLPSLIIQRSTASSPSSSNPVWTIVQDTNPFAPPGYFNKEVGLETEFPHFLEGSNDLIITGHSLGGSFTQLNMINFLKKLERDNLEFPDRNIKLVIFDSPAITKRDAMYFADWAKNNPDHAKKITIEYYFSKMDTVPGSGRFHLGVGCENTNVTVKFTLANPKDGAKEPELQLHPHGRYFFRTDKTKANTDLEPKGAAELKAYDNQGWRVVMEIFRRIAGMLIFTFLLIWLALKHVVIKCASSRSSTDNKVVDLSKSKLVTAR